MTLKALYDVIVKIAPLAGMTALILRVISFVRFYRKHAQLALQKIYKKHLPSRTPFTGSILVKYPTYSGLLVWTTQTTHNNYLAPGDAKEFLKSLRNYTLRWGLLCYGMCLHADPDIWKLLGSTALHQKTGKEKRRKLEYRMFTSTYFRASGVTVSSTRLPSRSTAIFTGWPIFTASRA